MFNNSLSLLLCMRSKNKFLWKKWSEEEDTIIMEHYKEGTEKLLTFLPNRSMEAMRIRARSLGVRKYEQKNLPKNISDFELGLVVGLIEGEGSMSITTGTATKSDKSYFPFVNITNKDSGIIDEVQNILKIGHIQISKDQYNKRYGRVYTGVYKWVVTSVNEALKLFSLLKGKFVSKRKEKLCELITEFCLSRKEILKRGTKHAQYSLREIEIVKEVRELNRRGKSLSEFNKLS